MSVKVTLPDGRKVVVHQAETAAQAQAFVVQQMKAGNIAPAPGPGIRRAATQGAVLGVTEDTLGMLDMVPAATNYLGKRYDAGFGAIAESADEVGQWFGADPGTVGGAVRGVGEFFGSQHPFARGARANRAARDALVGPYDSLGERGRAAGMSVLERTGGYQPPVTRGERFAESGGRALGAGVGTAPLALAGAPLRAGPIAARVGLDALQGQISMGASQTAQELGAPKWVQVVAGLTAGLGTGAVPVLAASGIRRGKTAGEIAEIIMAAPEGSPLAEIAQEGPEAIRRASVLLQRRLASAGSDSRARWEAAVRQGIDDSPEGVDLPLVQAGGADQTPGPLAQFNRDLATGDPEGFGRQYAEAREGNRAAMQTRHAGFQTGSEAADVPIAYRAAEEASDARAAGVWDEVDFDAIPDYAPETFTPGIENVRTRAGVTDRRYLPNEAIGNLQTTIPDEFGGVIPARELQKTRAALLRDARVAQRAGDTRTAAQGPYSSQLAGEIDEVITDPGWREAKAATAAHKARYAPEVRGKNANVVQAKVNQSLQTSGSTAAKRIISGKNGRPVDNARAAIAAMGDDTGPLEQALLDELIGKNGEALYKGIDAKIARLEDPAVVRALDVVLGPQRTLRIQELARTAKRENWGTEGRAASSQATNSSSNMAAIHALTQFATGGGKNPTLLFNAAGDAVGGKAIRWVLDLAGSEGAAGRIVQASLLDSELGLVLSRMPVTGDIGAWQTSVMNNLSRLGLRELVE